MSSLLDLQYSADALIAAYKAIQEKSTDVADLGDDLIKLYNELFITSAPSPKENAAYYNRLNRLDTTVKAVVRSNTSDI